MEWVVVLLVLAALEFWRLRIMVDVSKLQAAVDALKAERDAAVKAAADATAKADADAQAAIDAVAASAV